MLDDNLYATPKISELPYADLLVAFSESLTKFCAASSNFTINPNEQTREERHQTLIDCLRKYDEILTPLQNLHIKTGLSYLNYYDCRTLSSSAIWS